MTDARIPQCVRFAELVGKPVMAAVDREQASLDRRAVPLKLGKVGVRPRPEARPVLGRQASAGEDSTHTRRPRLAPGVPHRLRRCGREQCGLCRWRSDAEGFAGSGSGTGVCNIPPRSGGRQPWDDPERGGVKTRSLVRVPAVEVFGAALLVWIDGSVEQTGYRSLDVRAQIKARLVAGFAAVRGFICYCPDKLLSRSDPGLGLGCEISRMVEAPGTAPEPTQGLGRSSLGVPASSGDPYPAAIGA